MADVRTLVDRLRDWAKRTPDAPAVYGLGPAGFAGKTWREYDQVARSVGKALLALGVKPGEAVSIIARNRPEWLYAQLGILYVGAVPAPIYTTNTAEQVAYVVRHCGARVIFAENAEQHAKLVAEAGNVPALEKIVVMDNAGGAGGSNTLSWDAMLKQGASVDDAALDERTRAPNPDDLAFLCYTSGTTGNPKGVMLTHRNLDHMARVATSRYKVGAERVVSYLPLCHIAEQIMTNLVQLECGGEVFLLEDHLKLKEVLPVVRPTVFLGVPRVWEKFRAGLRERLAEATGIKAKLASWALSTELACFERELASGRPVASFRRSLARKLVISKIHAKLGLDRVKLAVTGSAPLGAEAKAFFASLALPIHDCYGLSETTGLLTTCPAGEARFDSVGRALEGVEVKIAEDGEILARGPNMTKGYFRDETQTAELWAGGWLHTGDVGELDERGHLKITDRKKELFKTSGGKYIAPQAIESKLKTIRGIGQASAIGDGRHYVTALLALDPEGAPKVAAELGIAAAGGLSALAKDPKFRAYVERRVEEDVNAKLARYETVKRFALLPDEWSVAGGELTPTFKLKRKAITQKYATAIESLYAEAVRAGA